MTNEQLLGLDGKMVKVITTKIDLGQDQFGKTKVMIGGMTTRVLRNPLDPRDGEDDLPEEIEAVDGVDVDEPDKKKFYDRLNKHFDLSDPLVDTGDEEFLRFAEGSDRSVYESLIGKEVFFKLTVTQKNPAYPPNLRAILWNVPKRNSITLEGITDFIAKRKAAKDAKAAADAAVFGA